jgi:hypothetical protein
LLTFLFFNNFIFQEAAKYGKKVMVLDFVTPTPLGTRWGKSLKYFRSDFEEAGFFPDSDPKKQTKQDKCFFHLS